MSRRYDAEPARNDPRRRLAPSTPPSAPHRDERGMALVAVVFLGMLFTIMGLAVFALAGYEYGQALNATTRAAPSGSLRRRSSTPRPRSSRT